MSIASKEISASKESFCLPNEKIIAVKQGNILATSFHPELTRDVSLHKQFVNMVKDSKN